MDKTDSVSKLASRIGDLLAVLPVDWYRVEPHGDEEHDENLDVLAGLCPGSDPTYVAKNLAIARASACALAANPARGSAEFVLRYVVHFFGADSGWGPEAAAVLSRSVFRDQRAFADRWREDLLDATYQLEIAARAATAPAPVGAFESN